MDVDFLKSSSTSKEDQMEMMMLMMQMDKLPEFCGPNIDMAGEFPSVDEFSGSSSGTSIGAPPPFFDNPNGIDPSSAVSYVNTHFQDSLSPAPPHTSGLCSNSSRFKSNIGDLSGASSSMSPSQKRNSMAAMREMIFRIAAMQPIHIDPESVKPPKRRNVKISKDPQSVAARHRRERISERIRILQRLVPGGTKMDTASMLDEAIHYVKFLKTQVQSLERAAATRPMGVGFPVSISNANYNNSVGKSYQTSCSDQIFNSTQQMLS